jgi:ABC-2 type transport system ATP-binding protein
MSTVASFEGVSFAYDRKAILERLDLRVQAGEVVLLAAPNGAGKSTALWLAGGLLRPASGSVRVLGHDPFRERHVLGRVGFVAEGAPLPESWTGHRVLSFQRDTFPRWDEPGCKRLVSTFGLDLSQRVKALSRGHRAKLGLVAALSTRPELLLLDEPMLGLDVATKRMVFAEILGRVAEAGCTIVMSGHEIDEAESYADRLVLIRDGRVEQDEKITTLLDRYRILVWDERVRTPPAELDLVMLHAPTGKHALARNRHPGLEASWAAAGGKIHPADLETIYLAFTGELDHA